MSGMHFAIATSDMDAAVLHLAAEGVRQTQEPRLLTTARSHETRIRRALYAGPDGEMIELRG